MVVAEVAALVLMVCTCVNSVISAFQLTYLAMVVKDQRQLSNLLSMFARNVLRLLSDLRTFKASNYFAR